MSPYSLVVRITAWYDWLLVVLVLMFGAYTCKCLDYCLSLGVKNALLRRAKEIGTAFAATGKIPPNQVSLGLIDSVVSVRPIGGLAPDSTSQRESQTFAAVNLRKEPNSLARSAPAVLRSRSDHRFLIASARTRFEGQRYIVELRAPKKPIEAIFRQAAFSLVLGLIVACALATSGSVFLVKRALAPVQKIRQLVQALPIAQPDEGFPADTARGRIESLSETLNEMVSKLEFSFQIGTGLPPEAFHEVSGRLGRVRQDLADSSAGEGLSSEVTATLLSFLEETERLSDLARELAMPSSDPKQRRTERLRFYLGGSATAGAEHVCVLIEKLGADLASQARHLSDGKFPVRW